MDLRSDEPFWPIADGLPRSYPPLTSDLDVEVLVLGAGISGAYLAYHLARAGHSVAVVDKRDVGRGSTAASTALLMAEVDTPLVELGGACGEARAAAAYRFCAAALRRQLDEISRLELECGMARKGTLYLASSRSDARGFIAETRARESAGLDVDLMSGPQVRRAFGLQRPAALRSPVAAELDPYLLTHGLLERASRLGARIHDRTTVRALELQANGAVLARTDRGSSVLARLVAVATGYETEEGSSPAESVQLVSSYALATEPIAAETLAEEAPALTDHLIWESARPYAYLRSTREGRILIGGEDERFASSWRRDRKLGRKRKALMKRLHSWFPGLRAESAYVWAGTFAETSDGLPRLGFSADGRRYYALGYGGNGVLFSFVAAEALVAHLRGDAPEALALFPLEA